MKYALNYYFVSEKIYKIFKSRTTKKGILRKYILLAPIQLNVYSRL